MEKEIWKDIKGYEGMYQISSFGRVKSLERVYYCGNKHSKMLQREIIMSQTSVKGYKRIALCGGIKRRSFLVHRLVAEAFLPIPESLNKLIGTRRLQVNHKDENLCNNTVANLEWCDASYNVNYGSRNEKMSLKNKNGKKSTPILCVETGIVYPSQAEIARLFGYEQSCISACCKRKGTSYGYTWRFVDTQNQKK